jgi:prophage regulatory protein
MDPPKRFFPLFIAPIQLSISLVHVANGIRSDPGGMWRHDMAQKILRRAEVEQATGLPRSTIYDAMAKGTFPRPIRLGDRSVGRLELEIVAWQMARIAARDGAAERNVRKS